jgi:hypothetical protein
VVKKGTNARRAGNASLPEPETYEDQRTTLREARGRGVSFGEGTHLRTTGRRREAPYVPRGYELAEDKLVESKRPHEPPPTADDVALVDELIFWLNLRLGRRHDVLPSFGPEERRAVLDCYEKLCRRPWGEDWRIAAALVLRDQVAVRVQEELDGKTGRTREPTDFPVWTPGQIVQVIRSHAPDAPAELNEAAIERALSEINLGGSGGRNKRGGRSARQWVNWFKKTVDAHRARRGR